MKTQMLIMTALFTMVPLTGCATITGGSTRKVKIESQPAGAEVTIVNKASGETVFAGQTPTVATLKPGAGYFRGADYVVTFEKAGYNPVKKTIQRGINMWYVAGNFFFGGLIGWVVIDPISGAMWTLEKDCCTELVPVPLSSATNVDGLNVVCLDTVPNHLRHHLRPVNRTE